MSEREEERVLFHCGNCGEAQFCPKCTIVRPVFDSMHAMLKKHEWSGGMYGGECPECHRDAVGDGTHLPSCALNALLKSCTGEV